MIKWLNRHDWPDLIGALGADQLTIDIGAGNGGFSRSWQDSHSSNRHIAIDLWASQPDETWPHFDNRPEEKYWKELKKKCDAASRPAPSFETIQNDGIVAAADFKNETVDALWIDASHNYSFLLSLLEAWWPKLKTGAIIGGASWTNQFHRIEGGEMMWLRTRQAISDFASGKARHVYTNQEGWPGYFFTKEVTKPSVTVVSGSTSNIPWLDAAQSNHRAYCDKHQLQYRWINFDQLDRHPVWGKIFALLKVIETSETDWVVWLDADAVFIDFSKTLSSFLVSGLDAILPEWGGEDNLCRPSSGVMFWKSNDRTEQLLKKVWNSPKDRFKGYGAEEDALFYIPEENPDLSSKCLLVDHRHFNSMMSSSIGWYDERDFIIHIGQVSSARRTGVISDLTEEARIRSQNE